MNSLLTKSYIILDRIRLPHGLYLASPSEDYSAVWIRDSVYISLAYLNKSCGTYEKTYYRLLDMLIQYEWKIDTAINNKPNLPWEYIHSKFCATHVSELPAEWGHAQHDAIGALLWGIGEGDKRGKVMLRNEKDREIVQKLVWYLQTCEYWRDADNGMWEEYRQVHASSVGACVSGLWAVEHLVNVPVNLVLNGVHALEELGDREIVDREVDLAQLSLIYPHKVYTRETAIKVLEKIETNLLKERGVIRYQGDSYYSTLEQTDGRHHPFPHYYGTEAEWCFGLPWLSLCWMELNDYDKAQVYLEKTEQVMLEDGSLPELYYAKTANPNPNTPLGWGNSLYILAKEKLGALII